MSLSYLVSFSVSYIHFFAVEKTPGNPQSLYAAMKKFLLYLFIQTLGVLTFSQTKTSISGTVMDASLQPVRSATVHILNTNSAAVTNASGIFSIENVFPGRYILEVSGIGYATITKELDVKNESSSVSVTLNKAPQILDEVIVTAQKKEELLQTVPISITSLSSAQIEAYRIWNTKDITAIVPGLYSADPGDKRNVSSLRGIATTSYDPAVATYIDGVNQFSLDTYIEQLFDVERIEVLRGPQGTLYGRNAMGGVINIITKQPQNKPEGFADIGFGNYGLQRYTAGVRVPLVKDKLFFGVAGLYEKFDGFYTNLYNNTKFDRQSSFTGNYYIKYIPAARWAITLNVKHNNNRNSGPFPLVNGADEALRNPFKLDQNATTEMTDNIFNSSLSVSYSGRGFNFSSQSSYQSNYRVYSTPIDGDFSPIDGVTLINNYGKPWNKVKVYTQDFRFTSPASNQGKFDWIAGAYFFHQDNPVKQATRFGNDAAMLAGDSNFSTINSSKAKSDGLAFYGQGTYKLSNKLSLTAGLRYDYERQEESILGEYQHDPNPQPVYDYRSDTSATVHFHAFSPKLIGGYKLSDKNFLFITYSKGYRTGGLTPLSSNPSQPALYAFKPEYSNNYEAGIKNTFYQNKIHLNLTAFYAAVTDAQVPTLVLPDAVTITKNTGKLISKGAEIEAVALLGKLQVDYNASYTNATFQDLKLSQNGSVVNLKGKKQIYTPDVTSMLALQYNVTLSQKDKISLHFRCEWRYLGKQYFDLANTISQASCSLFNSKAEVSFPKFSIAFWGRNLGNKKYISYAYDFGAVHLGDPETYGVTASVRL